MSVTNEEIARYWKRRQMCEDDHLYAAVKAAARLRARRLSDDDYIQFVKSLNENDAREEDENYPKGGGVKDWWTNSKYAYLNQPV